MPPTKSYVVRRLDSTEQEVTLLKKATGAECLDKVCKSLGILEKDYFGLRFLDKNGEYLWINLRNPLHEQLVPGNRMVMDMRVKYYIRPQKILQPVTRFHFFKQLRKELLQGRMQPSTLNKAARITALIAQIEKGDYRVGTEYSHKVKSKANNDSLEAKVRREHQKIARTSTEVAIEMFLEEVSTLETYGVELFHIVDRDRVRKVIGVGPDCVQLFSSNMEPLNRFTYSSIQYTAFHAKKFTALISSPEKSHPEQVDFELDSRPLAQALYRTITEFHTFFKREAVSRVVKTAGFCKSLLGNFKGQNPDRFYFDVVRTHREVIDHVWAILHPSARFMNGEDSEDVTSRGVSGSTSSSSANRANRRPTRAGGHHHNNNRASTGGNNGSSQHHQSEEAGGSGGHHSAPPLPPASRHMQRGSSGGTMPRSRSVQDSGLRPPNFAQMAPLPPYSQRSCSSDALMQANLRRGAHLRTIPTHGPHMASTATFNPYLSPSISETGSDGDEDLYAGGSECYVTMSSCSEATYLPSTRSDPGTTGRSYRPMAGVGLNHRVAMPPPPSGGGSDTSSDLYITSVDSECSGASYHVNGSPPPLYREVDDEHSVPLNFDHVPHAPPSGGNNEIASAPNSAGISLVSPLIPVVASSEPGSAAFDFDASAVLSRTQELEGELQRLRAAMTCRLCKQDPIGATFCPCGHTVCCFQCAQRLHACWECNVTVTSVQRMVLTR